MSHRPSEVVFILSHPLNTTHEGRIGNSENQDPGSIREIYSASPLHFFLNNLYTHSALPLALALLHFISTFCLFRHHFEMIPSIFMYRKKKRAIFLKTTIEAKCNPGTGCAEAGESRL